MEAKIASIMPFFAVRFVYKFTYREPSMFTA
jgi:hypothetical protein